MYMGESSKFPNPELFKLALCLQISTISSLNGQSSLDKLKIIQRNY